MLINHLFPNSSSRKEVEGDRAFFLRNQVGDFVSLYTSSQTRYAGWFLAGDAFGIGEASGGFYKILENIQLIDENDQIIPVSGITYTKNHQDNFHVVWDYLSGTQLNWQLIPNSSALRISLNQSSKLRIVLDMRKMYASPIEGRNYQVKTSTDGILISYFDPTFEGKTLYFHIRTSDPLRLKQAWQETFYPIDAARHSEPSHLYTYTLGEIQTDHLCFGAGWSSETATVASQEALRHKPEPIVLGTNQTQDTLLTQLKTAKLEVEHSLRLLQSEKGIYAGLPWFHQVWSRDELLAAVGLPRSTQKEIIIRYLGFQLENGELPTYLGSNTTCADGLGWLCLLINEYGLEDLDETTKQRLVHFLKTAQTQLQASRRAAHGLIYSGFNNTWMDTIGREGYRIEIQAAFCLVLELLNILTGEDQYRREQLKMQNLIREHFYKNGYLWDGLGDPTKRPNVYLAYLLQPELLNQNGWISCFEKINQVTNLEWGGLSSIDKTDPRFHAYSTGQDNQSYHNGDSWFLINNLAAVAMHRLNEKHFGKIIMEILQGSTNEILFENMIGHPGEIASAAETASWGCGIQAFAGGPYLALLKELNLP